MPSIWHCAGGMERGLGGDGFVSVVSDGVDSMLKALFVL